MPGRVYVEAKLEVRHITVLLRHVVFIGMIRAICDLFRANEPRVSQSLVCEYQRAKVHQVGYT